MKDVLLSPWATAVAVACVLVLGYFAIRGVWERREPEREHFCTWMRRAKLHASRRKKKAAGRAGTRTGGKR